MEAPNKEDRVRNNQRNSRARKKEYVLDIEKKLREFQSQGVEASAEIQKAARQVVHENHKLRQLLYTLGLNDTRIEQYIKTEKLDPSIHNIPLDLDESRMAPAGQKATVLERLLLPRWPGCLKTPTSSVPESRSGSTGQTFTCRTASDFSAEYGSWAEDFQQSDQLMSALPALNPPTICPQAAHPQTHKYSCLQPNEENVQHADSNHIQGVHGLLLNHNGYDATQTFDCGAWMPETHFNGR
ncbi:hypothetical protein LY76DRAFT_341692 [Colletotrichum caudatum]|nr:hypothetical protein LY76DRAFT_341692 [Colletotrichum caudatum]